MYCEQSYCFDQDLEGLQVYKPQPLRKNCNVVRKHTKDSYYITWFTNTRRALIISYLCYHDGHMASV